MAWGKGGKGPYTESTGLGLTGLIAALMVAMSASAESLEPVATITMPSVKGRIDHFAVDVKGQRLFVAALGNNTVEVLDTAANKHLKSLSGFGEPQGLVYLPQANRLYVANGTADRVNVLDGTTFSEVRRIVDVADADNVRYDPAGGMVLLGYGSGALRLLNAESADSVGEVVLLGHPESFQLETRGARVFVNVPTAQQIAVVDRQKKAVVATWPLLGADKNFPMALDEGSGRLFIGARSPALLLVYDTQSGKEVARLPIGADTDDLFYDSARRRIYVICGEGRIDVIRQDGPDRYTQEASTRTAPRARTGLFVPELQRLYVAAPASGSTAAQILVYRVQ